MVYGRTKLTIFKWARIQGGLKVGIQFSICPELCPQRESISNCIHTIALTSTDGDKVENQLGILTERMRSLWEGSHELNFLLPTRPLNTILANRLGVATLGALQEVILHLFVIIY